MDEVFIIIETSYLSNNRNYNFPQLDGKTESQQCD
jgi:hypothetical protein